MPSTTFKIIVIGGGHAGVEAALAAARMGVETALVSFTRAGIGQMSCNPAIGGLGKGHLVKEVDALGGAMGRAIDDTGIQFRTLNSSKGPAVQASRAQADRDLYKQRVLEICEAQPNLTIVTGEAKAVRVEHNRITGVELADGTLLSAQAAILTTGTFLRALMHTGPVKTCGGRQGDQASNSLSECLKAFGLPMGRLKTGTPPRLRRSSIDFSMLAEQPGEYPAKPFSVMTDTIDRPQISCWITETDEAVHEIIRANRERSPMFNGQITSGGPRYCPSIEDKVFRFADKASHNIFLEPEGFTSDIVYPNGISTSLPLDVQEQFVRKMRGLHAVEILKPGYAVEYDFVDPRALQQTLECKDIAGLFLAGQINGTSGYEEAAAQGLLAGINAALFVENKVPFTLSRGESYIGVMVDDLTTTGVDEPYRMFTSRAEYRLHLREDNAWLRLGAQAEALGVLSAAHCARLQERRARFSTVKSFLEGTRVKPNAETNAWLETMHSAELKDSISLAILLRRPEFSLAAVLERFGADLPTLDFWLHTNLETEVKFKGYLERQELEIARLRKNESTRIPVAFDYTQVKGLSNELRDKLGRVRPTSIAQAMRIPGITPAALSLLAIRLSAP